MYLNPTGSNPTGAVLSPARREEIYEICSMYDILILEDDPYYFMQFREAIQQTFYYFWSKFYGGFSELALWTFRKFRH